MTNFKRYFCLHMKDRLIPFICISVVLVAMTVMNGIREQPLTVGYHDGTERLLDYRSTLYLPVTFMCVCAYVFPVIEFSFFKKRMNLDCAYSLPIARRAMGAVHYLSGLIMLLGTFTAAYLSNFALLLTRGPGWFDFSPMFVHYLICILFGFIIYSFLSFAFNAANTTIDGVCFMFLYTFVFLLVSGFFAVLIENTGSIIDEGYETLPWGIIDRITDSYQKVVELERINDAEWFWNNTILVGWFCFWTIIGVASAVGLLFSFGQRRPEKTQELSSSFFGYRTLIPLYAVCGMMFYRNLDYMTWFLIELLVLLGYTIYRRGFHYKKSDIIVMCSLVVFLFI